MLQLMASGFVAQNYSNWRFFVSFLPFGYRGLGFEFRSFLSGLSNSSAWLVEQPFVPQRSLLAVSWWSIEKAVND